MPIRQSRSHNVAIRLAGLAVLPIGAFSINWLYHLVHIAPAHEGTLAELGLAAAGFLCLSMGSVLLSLGSHLFDEVKVSARWAPRPGAGLQQKWIGSDEPIARTRLPMESTDPGRWDV